MDKPRAMRFRPIRPRMPCMVLGIAAVLGIVLADLVVAPAPLVVVGACGAAALAWLRPRAWSAALVAVAAFFGIHTLRHQHGEAKQMAAWWAEGPRVVTARGVVISEPVVSTSRRREMRRFRLSLQEIELDGRTLQVEARVNTTWMGEPVEYGDRVTLRGSIENLKAPRNPGEVDFSAYLRRQGIYSELVARYPSDCKIIGEGHGWKAQAFAFGARDWIKKQLERDLEDSPELASLIQSMVLGMRAESAEEFKELFQRTGTLHLFAVSGLNIAMLSIMAWYLLKPLQMGRRTAAMVTIPILIAYAMVTGLSASCVRATVMGSAVLLAYVVDRPAQVFNSLAAAALVILMWDTNELFSPGFQFSFVLVFALVGMSERISKKVDVIGQPDPFLPRPLWTVWQRGRSVCWRFLALTCGVTLASWVGSMPLTAGYFHLISPVAIIANFVTVPVAFLILAFGLLSVLTMPWCGWLGVVFNNANWLCAKSLLGVVKVCALLPGGYWYVEVPGLQRAPAYELTVYDVASGGAVHCRSGGKDWLFDAGSGFHYERVLLPSLRSRGVNSLDGLIMSHGDAAHVGGALAAIDDFRPETIVDSAVKDRSPTRKKVRQELSASGRGVVVVWRGDELRLSERTTMRVLYPPPGLKRNAADDKALVLLIEGGGVRTLLMSDSGFATEQWLIENEPELRADVVVKGQHAKDASGTIDFLRHVEAKAVICSVGDYGYEPARLNSWESDVRALGVEVFRQDACGAVRMRVGEGEGDLEMDGYLNGQVFRSRAR